jgi:ABC-type branched-subunit amino acid transport system ATPase component
MQEFLTVLLGLQRYESAIAVSQEKVKTLDIRVHNAKAVHDQAASSLQAILDVAIFPIENEKPFASLLEEAEKHLEEQVEVCNRAKVAADVFKMNWYRERKELALAAEREVELVPPLPEALISQMPASHDAKVKLREECSARMKRAVQNDIERIQVIDAAIQEARYQIQHYKTLRNEEPRLLKEKERLLAEIEKLRSQQCPRCEQPWLKVESDLVQCQEDLVDVEDRLKAMPYNDLAIKGWEETLQIQEAAKKPDPKIEQLRAMFQSLTEEIAAMRATAGEAYKLAQSERNQQITALKLKHQKSINALDEKHRVEHEALCKIEELTRVDVEEARQTVWKAREALKDCQNRNQRHVDANDRREAQLLVEQAKYDLAKKNYDDFSAELSKESDLLDVFKTFLTAIFDEVLEEIAWNTNEMLQHVPNVAHVRIRFRSENTTQKGTIKRAIVPVVTIAGAERPLRSALSGGMATAVELAVDLAVRKVISARTGVTPGWLILDECFEGLGTTEKEACLTLLKRAAQDILIIVVDHASEFKEMFDQRLTIVNENGESRIS